MASDATASHRSHRRPGYHRHRRSKLSCHPYAPPPFMKSFNTWFYGKSPTPLLKEPSEKRDYLRFILRFDKLTVPRMIEGQPADIKASYPSSICLPVWRARALLPGAPSSGGARPAREAIS